MDIQRLKLTPELVSQVATLLGRQPRGLEDIPVSHADGHRAHILLRESFIPDDLQQQLQALGFGEVLARKGIGGIADFTRIRCLHTWYAAHLVVPNTVGVLLDEWWREQAAN